MPNTCNWIFDAMRMTSNLSMNTLFIHEALVGCHVLDPPRDGAAELVRRVKSGGAREGDLLRYLELSGAGE